MPSLRGESNGWGIVGRRSEEVRRQMYHHLDRLDDDLMCRSST